MFSSAARYALRATAHLGSLPADGYVPARQLAEALDIPPTFLAKVLKQLVDAGLLVAFRGPTGGVKLSRPADEITLRQIIESVDGSAVFTECVLGLPGCGDLEPCPLHEGWAPIRGALAAEFDRQTIASVSEAYLEGALRLRP
ncbi:MAG: Rrf2 family transcriptional regulator [Rhodothermales bacterium]|nr:Rrf2 family transcriptional regulator [Rhodothermales bacterium]